MQTVEIFRMSDKRISEKMEWHKEPMLLHVEIPKFVT